MPIFSRRRLFSMLSDISSFMNSSKRSELLSRMNHSKTTTALPAEAELGLMWAISRVVPIEIEPEIEGRFPEVLARDLIAGREAVIEVTALSDDGMSGETEMRRAVALISAEADKIKKKSRNHLYFQFCEESGHGPNGYFRRRCVTSDYVPSIQIIEQLRDWISRWPSSHSETVRLKDNYIDVVVSYREKVFIGFNFHSTMPVCAYSLTDNSLYKALRKKERQLPKRSGSVAPCIFLMDVGCTLLRNLNDHSWRGYSGSQIIMNFLQASDIDVVAVFSCKRDWSGMTPMHDPLRWTVTWFHRDTVTGQDLARLREVARELPPPLMEGYSARSRHKQGHFSPGSLGSLLGAVLSWHGDGSVQIKISTRALQQILAGRTTLAQYLGGDMGLSKLIKDTIDSDLIISKIEFEEGGIDCDDDRVIIHFDHDAFVARSRAKT